MTRFALASGSMLLKHLGALLVFASLGCETSPANEMAHQGRALEFEVVDVTTGAPIAGATVEQHLHRRTGWLTARQVVVGRITTDAKGVARFDGVVPRHQFMIRKSGYNGAAASHSGDGAFRASNYLPPDGVVVRNEKRGRLVVPLGPSLRSQGEERGSREGVRNLFPPEHFPSQAPEGPLSPRVPLKLAHPNLGSCPTLRTGPARSCCR